MENNRYPRQCCIMLKLLDEAGRVTWATKVKNLLSRYGFDYAWQNQGLGNETRFLFLFKSRLRDILIQEWVSDINTSSKANHYRNFYGSFEIQFYLKNMLPVY